MRQPGRFESSPPKCSRRRLGPSLLLLLATLASPWVFADRNPASDPRRPDACEDLLSGSRRAPETPPATVLPVDPVLALLEGDAEPARGSVLSEGDYLERHATISTLQSLPLARPGNAAYIARAIRISKEIDPATHFFIDVENSVLKALNDKVYGNKRVVDSIHNAFMKELHSRIERDPVLRVAIERSYADYKSSRFTGEVADAARRAEVVASFSRAYREAVDAFVGEFAGSELAAPLRGLSGPLGEPRNWFLAGWGASADEANAAVRAARSVSAPQGTAVQSFRDVEPILSRRLARLRTLTDELDRSTPRGSLLLVGHPLLPAGRRILSADAIELMRKVDFSRADALESARTSLRDRLRLSMDAAAVARAAEIFSLADGFSASLLIEERQIIDLGEAGEGGIVSADFAGMGAVNLHETLAGLVYFPEASPSRAVKEARQAVARADVRMDAMKDWFRNAVAEVMGAKETRRLKFSGDDGIWLPSRPLPDALRERFLKRLAGFQGSLRSFRVTFVPIQFGNGDSIPTNLRSRTIVQAEEMEKNLRVRIDAALTREWSNELLFGIELRPGLASDPPGTNASAPEAGIERGGVRVRVVVSTLQSREGNLPERVVAEVEAAIREALPSSFELDGVDWTRVPKEGAQREPGAVPSERPHSRAAPHASVRFPSLGWIHQPALV